MVLVLAAVDLGLPASSDMVSHERGSPARELSPSGPIRIESDTDFNATAAAEGWPGNGSPDSPYIIENLDIDANGADNAVMISNTTYDFIIRNCIMRGAGSDGYRIGAGMGILIDNVLNGTIESNEFVDNLNGGIYLRNSRKMIVRNCTVSGDEGYIGLVGEALQEVRIEDCSFRLSHGNGIFVSSSSSIILKNNHIPRPLEYGMSIRSSSDMLLQENTIGSGDRFSLLLYMVVNSRMYSNRLLGTRLSVSIFPPFFGTLEIPPNNTVDGAPIYFFKNGDFSGERVPLDAGQVIILNVTGLEVAGLRFHGSGNAVTISSSSGILLDSNIYEGIDSPVYSEAVIIAQTIDGLVIRNQSMTDIGIYGIDLIECNDVRIEECMFENVSTPIRASGGGNLSVWNNTMNGSDQGVRLERVEDVLLASNHVKGFSSAGMYANSCLKLNVTNNTLTGDDNLHDGSSGIRIVTSKDILLSENTVERAGRGIVISGDLFILSSGIRVFSNIIRDMNGTGLEIIMSRDCLVRSNLFFNNSAFGTSLSDVENATMLSNTFIANNGAGEEYSTLTIQASQQGSSCVWSVDGRGNHWSDWTSPDEDLDGIVDLPYLIFGSTVYDEYPVTEPMFTFLSAPSSFEVLSGRDSVELHFSRPVFDLDGSFYGYLVFRSTGEEGNWTSMFLGSSRTMFLDEDVEDGQVYHYYMRALNRYGEGNRTRILTAVPDSSPPAVTIISPEEGAVEGNAEVDVSWNMTDNIGVTEVLISLDGGAMMDAGLGTSFHLSNLTEGPHSVRILVFDALMNNASAIVNFTVDISPPGVVILQPRNGTVLNMTVIHVRWDGTDDVSKISRYLLKLDDGPWSDMGNSTEADVDAGSPGIHVVRLKAVDVAGHEYTAAVEVLVDIAPPELFISYPPDGYSTTSSTVKIFWVAYDRDSAMASFELRLDGELVGELPAGASNHTLTGLTVGSHILMLSGRDIAGNMRTSIISFEVIEEVHEAELVVISGRIVDSDGNPVGGARIESGTGEGAISDSGGYFFIEMERGIVTLTITRKGYKDVYINIDARYDGNESLDDIVMEKEREEDNDSALVELFRSNTYCQVCCGALIIVPIFLMLLGLLARSRSRSRKRREYEE